jgi:hypothetical protein
MSSLFFVSYVHLNHFRGGEGKRERCPFEAPCCVIPGLVALNINLSGVPYIKKRPFSRFSL